MTLSPRRLQRLVKHRERIERLQEERFADAQRQHVRRELAIAEAEARRDGVYEAGAPASGNIEPAELVAAAAYLARLKREIGARKAALVHSAETVAAERRQLMERRRDRKAMETLLEHRFEEERTWRNRHEIGQIDEAAGRGWLANER